MSALHSFKITQLNHAANVALELRARHCIIVGPNGSGKSTALQVLAYALGRNWKGLAALRFDRLDLKFVDGEQVSIGQESCASFVRSQNLNPRFEAVSRLLIQFNELEAFLAADLKIAQTANKFSRLLRYPPNDLRTAQRSLRLTTDDQAAQSDVLRFLTVLKSQGVPLTFYLPTYRRIELELDRFLADVPEVYSQRAQNKIQAESSGEFFLELVKFGMEDIVVSIQAFERETRDYARNRFNRMMSYYLKEMVNANVLSIGDLRSRNIDAARVETVLSRIEEGLLSTAEKNQISSTILGLASGPGAGNQPFAKKWLAHFFVRLMEVNSDIEERERNVTNLARDLQKYLRPKLVAYDIEKYHFSISTALGKELALSDLSSGEKQLVSVLTQMHLRGNIETVNIFIDEPELSLSVPWQATLLPDIVNTAACHQLFVVTHSPFMYDNILGEAVLDFAPVLSSVET